DSHLGATADLVLLSALASLGVQAAPLFFVTETGLLTFRRPQLVQLSLMRFHGRAELCVHLGPPRFLHGTHASQFFFHTRQLFFSNAPARLFRGEFARFRLNSQTFFFGTFSRGPFLSSAPLLAFLFERPIDDQLCSFDFGAPGLFLCAQPQQFRFKLLDLLFSKGLRLRNQRGRG